MTKLIFSQLLQIDQSQRNQSLILRLKQINIFRGYRYYESLQNFWVNDWIDYDEEKWRIQQIQFIENPKITADWQGQEQNQQLIETIYDDARTQINLITNRALFEELVRGNSFLMGWYDFYQAFSKCCEAWDDQNIAMFEDTFGSHLLTQEINAFRIVLITLYLVNPIISTSSFAFFQRKVFIAFSALRQLSNILLCVIFTTLRMQEIMQCWLIYQANNVDFGPFRQFSSEGYIKFKNYASKFSGNIATSVFNYEPDDRIENKITGVLINNPFYIALMWRAKREDTMCKIPTVFIQILSLQSIPMDELWVMSFYHQLQSNFYALFFILEVLINDFFIPAIECSFNQLILLINVVFGLNIKLNAIGVSQILLNYVKSKIITSKREMHFQNQQKRMNFSNYSGLKKRKGQLSLGQCLLLQKVFQKLIKHKDFFVWDLDQLIQYNIQKQVQYIKLNQIEFFLVEVNPIHIPYINTFLHTCPKKLQFLQHQIEAKKEHQMKFCVKRIKTIKAFSYSYFQTKQQFKNKGSMVGAEITLNIDDSFLKLDRYIFEQFYFEVSGNLILNNCEQLFARFTQLIIFKASIIYNSAIQNFQFERNIRSKQLKILDITFQNISLDFQHYPFRKLSQIKMILKFSILGRSNQSKYQKLQVIVQLSFIQIYLKVVQDLLQMNRKNQTKDSKDKGMMFSQKFDYFYINLICIISLWKFNIKILQFLLPH
ncbi:unnamed protein product [Paramecium octaurelia]|uniref:Transmembrane protein n=1 Tax=Paramecium octaurelia TaxID=43137 RepID=A0A8S1YLG3_PAROT|nr:unnamed protein product [Paramecium octaurelia]